MMRLIVSAVQFRGGWKQRYCRVVLSFSTAVAVALLAACGPSAPSGSDYLGRWEGTIESLGGSEGNCHLEISTVGQSFVIKSLRQRIGNCAAYEGVWTLTAEGNLRGGLSGDALIAYDKKSGRAAVSGLGRLRYLRRTTDQELQSAFFEGRWQVGKRIPAKFDAFEIEPVGDGRLTFRGGIGQPDGRIEWLDAWPAEVRDGVVHISFAGGTAKLTKRKEAADGDELTYEEGKAAAVCLRM